MEQSQSSGRAPYHQIPLTEFSSIEHPAIIRNLDKGIASLGGQKAITKFATEQQVEDQNRLKLRLRPDDPFQLPIYGNTVGSNDLLLKVTVPRQRRRRRRRIVGPDGAERWEYGEWEDVPLQNDEHVWEKVLRNDPGVKVEIVGKISRTARFRAMADFQRTLEDSPFVKKVEDTLLSGDYDKVKDFALDPARGSAGSPELLPPPQFTDTIIPFNYQYLQNRSVKKIVQNGQAVMFNSQQAPKILTIMIHMGDSPPDGPPAEMTPYDKLDNYTKQCVDALRDLFARRKIWTKRALVNHFPPNLLPLLRFSLVHVGYMLRSGPFRDTCIAYGVKPTGDPKWRKYQSVFFQSDEKIVFPHKEEEERQQLRSGRTADDGLGTAMRRRSHIFDGQSLNTTDGSAYQLCDITDPILKALIDRDRIRPQCHAIDGWYTAMTMYKLKEVMRKKINAMIRGDVLPDSSFVDVLEIPSDEDEEGNFRVKDWKLNWRRKRETERARTRGKKSKKSQKEEEEMEAEDEEDGGVRILEGDDAGVESEWRAETVDGRVTDLLRRMGGLGDNEDDMEEADEFTLLDEGDDY